MCMCLGKCALLGWVFECACVRGGDFTDLDINNNIIMVISKQVNPLVGKK